MFTGLTQNLLIDLPLPVSSALVSTSIQDFTEYLIYQHEILYHIAWIHFIVKEKGL